MNRNWGFPSETSRIASGEQPQPGSLHGAYTTRADNVIHLFPNSVGDLPNSRSQEGEPFIQPFEFGSYCLLVGFCLAPAFFVGALILGYALFVAKPI